MVHCSFNKFLLIKYSILEHIARVARDFFFSSANRQSHSQPTESQYWGWGAPPLWLRHCSSEETPHLKFSCLKRPIARVALPFIGRPTFCSPFPVENQVTLLISFHLYIDCCCISAYHTHINFDTCTCIMYVAHSVIPTDCIIICTSKVILIKHQTNM